MRVKNWDYRELRERIGSLTDRHSFYSRLDPQRTVGCGISIFDPDPREVMAMRRGPTHQAIASAAKLPRLTAAAPLGA
jgi:hypothetical protein